MTFFLICCCDNSHATILVWLSGSEVREVKLAVATCSSLKVEIKTHKNRFQYASFFANCMYFVFYYEVQLTVTNNTTFKLF